jgi:hypothetical protein
MGVIFILLVIFSIVMFFIKSSRYEESIKNQVQVLGGKVISIEKTMFNNGPFFIKGKGKSIYRFQYTIGNEIKEGWVRFGSLFGPDWRL